MGARRFSLVDKVIGRATWVRDARGRGRWVENPLATRLRLVFTGAGISVLLVGIVFLVARRADGGWWAGTSGLLIVLSFTVAENLTDGAKHRRKSMVHAGLCPWCGRHLGEADTEYVRRCSCGGEWWDAPGLTPSESPVRYRHHVLATSLALGLFAVFQGTMAAFPAWSGSPVKEALGCGGVSFMLLLIASAWGVSSGAVWWCSLAGAAPAFVGAAASLVVGRSGEPLVVLLGLSGLMAVGGLLGSAVGRWVRPREVMVGVGRVCAECGYDLRGVARGRVCPECGSAKRVR